MSSPTTTVIVPAYNQERFLRQALDSVAAQTLPASQIIVVDDHSSDRTVQVAHRWHANHPDAPLTVIAHERNRGLCRALNSAMELVTSDYVLTLYGDDWLEPERIARQSGILASAAADVSMVIGSMREVDRRGMPLVEHDYAPRVAPLAALVPLERVGALVERNVIPAPAVMLRTRAVREAGGYDENLLFDDYDMWMRLLGHSTLIYHPDIVVNYRLLDDSLSHSQVLRPRFLVTEARIVHKHRGRSADLDQRIRCRLTGIADTLAAGGEKAHARAVRELLADVPVGGTPARRGDQQDGEAA